MTEENEDLQIRSVQITEVDSDEGTFTGLFAPYNEVISYGGAQERYERGLFDGADLVEVYYNHGKQPRGGDMPIGEVTRYVETDDGLGMEARFYLDTERGKEAYALTKAGKLNSLSAGFVPTQVRNDGDVTVWERAHLSEVSLVKRPAYPSAQISQVRSESQIADNTNEKEDANASTNMTENVNYDDSEIRSELERVTRELAVFKEGNNNSGFVVETRSGGEFLKGLRHNEDWAIEQARSFDPEVVRAFATTSNSVQLPIWQDRLLRFVWQNRIGYNLFSHKALASQGNSIEFPIIGTTSGVVSVQTNEGDALAYNQVSITTGTANVYTVGGYVSISRQAIERSNVDYLNTALENLARNYAAETNSLVVTAALGAAANTGTGFTRDSATGADFLKFALEGSEAIHDNTLGGGAAFIWASNDVFNVMASLLDTTGRPLLTFVANGDNAIGSVSVGNGVTAYLAGLPVVRDPGLPAKTMLMGSPDALEIYENPGAPLNLNQDDVVHLLKNFAMYGYLAIAVPNPKGLFKVTIS